MKAINYKTKKVEWVRLFFRRKPLRPEIIQNMSYVYIKNFKYDKNQKLVYFFVKTRVEAIKVITNSLKTLDL